MRLYILPFFGGVFGLILALNSFVCQSLSLSYAFIMNIHCVFYEFFVNSQLFCQQTKKSANIFWQNPTLFVVFVQ